jgi:hypothetical protein
VTYYLMMSTLEVTLAGQRTKMEENKEDMP